MIGDLGDNAHTLQKLVDELSGVIDDLGDVIVSIRDGDPSTKPGRMLKGARRQLNTIDAAVRDFSRRAWKAPPTEPTNN